MYTISFWEIFSAVISIIAIIFICIPDSFVTEPKNFKWSQMIFRIVIIICILVIINGILYLTLRWPPEAYYY